MINSLVKCTPPKILEGGHSDLLNMGKRRFRIRRFGEYFSSCLERQAAAKDTTKEEDEAKAIVAKEETSEESTAAESANKAG